MILTQMPLVNTKEDFWALIQEHNVHTIVMLNNVTETEVCVKLPNLYSEIVWKGPKI